MKPTRIALASCSNLPDWEVDDRHLHRVLSERGIPFELVPWDQPGVDWGSFSACLVRTTWDYQAKWQEFLRWTQEVAKVTRLFNPPNILAWNLRKTYLRELGAKGAPLIPTIWLQQHTAPDLLALLNLHGWQRAFLKPVVGASAIGTLRFDSTPSGLQAANAHLQEWLPKQEFMLQPYLDQVETTGEFSALFMNGMITHCVRKVPVPGDYRVQDDYGAHDELTFLAPDELELATRIMDMVEPNLLYGRVDLLRDHSGKLVLTELELVEPSLFFRHNPKAADVLVEGLLARL